MKTKSRTFIKLLSLALCLMMVFGNGTVGISTVYAADTTMAGDGSATDPYQITNYAQLQEFSSIVNGGDRDVCGILMNDITVESGSTGFTPIGTYDNKYSGTFDGRNHKIDGISIIFGSSGMCGLFLYIDTAGVLKNLILSNVTIDSVQCSGVFVCDNAGTVKNCILTGNVTFGKCDSSDFAAIASSNDGTIINCINQCNIDAGSKRIYLVGISTTNSGTISGCCNFGNLSGYYVYGICGGNTNIVSRCANFGKITATERASGLISNTWKSYYSSGIPSVSECYNVGEISGGSSSSALIWLNENNEATLSNIYYNSETSGCTDNYATGKTTAELKGASVLTTLGFSSAEWTVQENDYPLPTGVAELLNATITLEANNGTEQTKKQTATNFKSFYPECTFTNGTKTFCGWYKDAECQQPWTETDIVYGDMTLYAGWTTYKQGETIEFGSYPQSKVSDTELISELDSVTKSWTSYGYYTGTGKWDDGNMTSSDCMQYADFTYKGTEYRAVKISKYRPYSTGGSSSADNSVQDEIGYTAGTDNIYYFKYEPIKWKILDPATGLVLSEAILDSQAYNNYCLSGGMDEYNKIRYWGDSAKTYYANNYAESSIKDWLNDDFCNTAFSDDQQNIIKSTALDNSAYSADYSAYDSAPTTDKIYLLSYSDVLNSNYGFSTSTSSSSTRTAQGTDYAKCQGLYVYSGNSSWRLRSAGYGSHLTCGVSYGGYVDGGYGTHSTSNGVRAALNLNLESEILKTEITSDMVEDIPDYTYTGEEFKPTVIIKKGENTLTENTDYTVSYSNNTNAGTAAVIITGIGKYKGVVTKEFKINKRSVTLTSGSDTKTYDGTPLTNGNVAVSGDGFVGGEGATYDLTGSRTIAGYTLNTFTYTLENGAKEYNYEITSIFGTLTIDAKTITEEMISGIYNASYTGKPIEWNIVVKDGDKTLTENTDYNVLYENNTNAGPDATVTITGIGNYGGTVTEKFTISPAAQSAPTGITSTDETQCSANNGTISGLTTAMEISSDGIYYSRCTAETMTGLAPGTYSIRFAAYENYAASDPTQVEIKKGDCYGGAATCISKAVCDGCGNEYGELGTHDYEWQSDETHYWQKCIHCGAETQKKDLPSITLNCPEKICKDQIPEITFTVPEGWSFSSVGLGCSTFGDNFENSKLLNGNEYALELVGDELTWFKKIIEFSLEINDNKIQCKAWIVSEDGFYFSTEWKDIIVQTEHSGGTATCSNKAVCEVCGEEYGEVDENNHEESDWIVDKAASEGVTGSKHKECNFCGKVLETAEIEALAIEETNPQTGDNGNIVFYNAITLLTIGCYITATIVRRKKSSQR